MLHQIVLPTFLYYAVMFLADYRIDGEQYIGPNKITCYDHSQHYWTEDTD